MKVIIDKISNIHKYKKDWDILYQKGNFTPFQSFEWLIMLVKEYNKNILLKFSSKAYIAVLLTNRIEILFPFYIKKLGRKRGVFLLGSGGKTDYLDFMHNNEIDHLKLQFLLKSICSKFTIKKIVFQLLNSNSQSHRVLNVMKELNLERKSECAVIKLPIDPDDYYKTLSKSFKQNIRTAKNRLSKDGKNYAFRTFFSNTIDVNKLDDYKKIYKQRYTEKNTKFNVIDRLFRNYDIYFDALNKVTNCIVGELIIDNKIASYFVSFVDYKGGIYISRITYDSTFNRYSPGILLIESLINDIYKGNIKNCTFIDLTNGSEAYKYSFKAERHYTHLIELEMV